MWQMILDELTDEPFTPEVHLIHVGSWAYLCPICLECVGIYRTDEGMVFRRDTCKNGHRIDWRNI